MLGRVIEKVTGRNYVEYLRAEVLRQLGLERIDLGRTLPKDRNPREPVYLDPGSGRNVMRPDSKVRVCAPDGTFYLEALDAHGGLIGSSPDLVHFLQAHWLDGRPRGAGEAASYTAFGSLPGTWAVVMQRPDGINQRTDPSGLAYDRLEKILNNTADGIRRWPAPR